MGKPKNITVRMKTGPKPKALAERFWEKIDRAGPDACWIWKGALDRRGYGKIGAGGRGCRTLTASRLAWELANGPIPPDLHVLHRCDTPPCCNPSHLFVGTMLDNVKDMDRKGRRCVSVKLGEAHPNAKLTTVAVLDIRRSTEGGSAIALRYGVTKQAVRAIRSRKSWRHLP